MNISNHRYMVHIISQTRNFERQNQQKWSDCAGTIVGIKWIVTSADCVIRSQYLGLEIYYGSNNLVRDPGKAIGAEKVLYHPEYSNDSLRYNIALIKTSRVMNTDIVVAIFDDFNLQSETINMTSVTILGYGEDGEKKHDYSLKSGQVTIGWRHECWGLLSPTEQTSVRYPANAEKTLICANGPSRPCFGDDGGPLILQNAPNSSMPYTIVGVIPHQDAAACQSKKKVYTLYTPIKNHLLWILSTFMSEV